jgi:L-ascorbate metabolism protein UlaG (beta-lactamase superfamily)
VTINRFFQEVEMELNEMVGKIHWLGHDSFRIDAGLVIYVDPYEIEPGVKADLILITHAHMDHCSPDDIAKIQKDDTIIVTEKESAAKLGGDVRVVKPGDEISVGGIKIEVVPAYNTNKNFHPKANGWLGFILEIEGIRIYHAGDTDFIPEMENFTVDIALLPVSGTYVMTADEAVEAALAIDPKLAVPMHFGSIVGAQNDADTFKTALEGRLQVAILPKE